MMTRKDLTAMMRNLGWRCVTVRGRCYLVHETTDMDAFLAQVAA